ncbi:CHAT domain-containing protein [Anabaena sphaerica FACHB-251]|uniref:CHAT domain-containing protein n=1 Tax=Anabaena sphaerica FACHB-251 TaxID=2692883 RepID=A0A926WH14_9NOST|nr:CHAT domain-containing protein [Anabaena sphaerica]MBD2293306.1 CHAT domain-containing protein [Anabaena sphaerica FACHB-251]
MFHNRWKKAITFSLLFALVFLSTITFNLLLQNQSAYAVKEEDWDRFLKNKNFIEAVNEVEKHWEKDYEQYFDQNLADFTLTAEDIGKTLTKISQQTSTKSAVIWIWPRETQLQLVIITPGKKPQVYSVVEADKKTLMDVIKRLNVAITSPSRRRTKAYLEPAQTLYKWMVKPLESTLETEKIDTILFCLGSGLRTLPIAALHDGKQFLVEKYAIARIPAFNLMNSNYKKTKYSQVLAMGASEFSQLESLPAVPVELNEITQELGSSKQFINQEFTLKNFQAQRKKQPFKIVHLATHAEFKPGNPDQSYIQFWGNERIRLDEIDKLNLDKPPVDLLVLSACRTALGDQEAELGFAGLTVKSGVKSVLASIWNVSDVGTLALMTEFYQHLQQTPLKAKALQAAQVAMLKGKVGLKRGELQGSSGGLQLPSELAALRDETFSHPYYWSAFTIIGNPW